MRPALSPKRYPQPIFIGALSIVVNGLVLLDNGRSIPCRVPAHQSHAVSEVPGFTFFGHSGTVRCENTPISFFYFEYTADNGYA